MTTEPVLIAGAIQAIIVALVTLGVFVLTDIQQGAINVAVIAILSVIVRHQVSPVAKF